MEKFNTHIKPKSPEKLQAQVEAFGDSGVKQFSEEQEIILKNSAELARIEDLNNLPDDLPDELKD